MKKPSVQSNKEYIVCDISQIIKLFENKVFDNYLVSEDILVKLAKDIGFSYDMYRTLLSISASSSSMLIQKLCEKSNIKDISLLLDKDNGEIINYSLEAPRTPLLNSEFINRAFSILESCSEVEISEVYYHPEDIISSIIVNKKAPVVIEEKYLNGVSKNIDYKIGILLVNDELNYTYSRLVVYVNNQPLYFPATYYNSTSSRYKKSTQSAEESIEVLLLKVIDDLREDTLYNKIYDFHYKYRANKDTVTSYEEYSTVLKSMRKIPTVIEDDSILESLLERYENFERRYAHLEDQKSSYIWRCTATGEITIDNLISLTANILSELGAPAVEYYNIRELLGYYISTPRMADEIAREDL